MQRKLGSLEYYLLCSRGRPVITHKNNPQARKGLRIRVFVVTARGRNVVLTVSVVLGAELANGFAGAPHFTVVERLELCVEFLAVVGLGVAVD